MRHMKYYALAAICLALSGCAGRESTKRKFEENDIDKRVMSKEISDLQTRLNVVEGRVDDVAGTVGVLSTGIYEVKTARSNKRTSYVAYAPPMPREAPVAAAVATAPVPAAAPGPAPVPTRVETNSAPLSLPPAGVGAPAPVVPAATPAPSPAKAVQGKPAQPAAPGAPVQPVIPAMDAAGNPLPPPITLPSDNMPNSVDTRGGRMVLPNAAPAPAVPAQSKTQQSRQQPAKAPAPSVPDTAPALSLPPEGNAPAPRRITNSSKEVSEYKPGEESAYKAALNLVTSGQAVAGENKFREFLRDYPSGRYAPNAEYWIGEALYSQSKYREALEQFKLAAAKYPKHHKTADALLKAGMTSDRLGDKAGAAEQYRTLLADFPQSESAGRVKGKYGRTALTMNTSQ